MQAVAVGIFRFASTACMIQNGLVGAGLALAWLGICIHVLKPNQIKPNQMNEKPRSAGRGVGEGGIVWYEE